MLIIQYACICRRGKVRLINQDNITWCGNYLPMGGDENIPLISDKEILTGKKLFGIFDGMGGEQRGEAASFIAAKAAAAWAKKGAKGTLRDLCLDMNRMICEYTEQQELRTCGTTAAMLLFGPQGVEGCNLGDSRIYLCRNGGMRQMSEDHVWPVFQNRKPPLLQYLGIPETEMSIEPHLFRQAILPGDTFMICSDGVTDMLPEDRLLAELRAPGGIEKMAEDLLDAVLFAGGKDNISLILACASEKL